MSTGAKVSLSALVAMVGLIAAFALRGEDLSDGVDWLPRCILNAATGLHCPGCGNTRATKALLNGDVAGAWQQNAAFVIALPFLTFGAARLWVGWVFPGRVKPLPFSWKYHYSLTLIGLVVLFGVLRNVPAKPFSWLAPVTPVTSNDAGSGLPAPETPRP